MFWIRKNYVLGGYPDDFPFPSCLIFGKGVDGKVIHVVASDEGSESRIITAYFSNRKNFKNLIDKP